MAKVQLSCPDGCHGRGNGGRDRFINPDETHTLRLSRLWEAHIFSPYLLLLPMLLAPSLTSGPTVSN
jgi:hypothetical protein